MAKKSTHFFWQKQEENLQKDARAQNLNFKFEMLSRRFMVIKRFQENIDNKLRGFNLTQTRSLIRFKSDSEYNGNFLFLVRALEKFVKDDANCISYKYAGDFDQTIGGECDNWPSSAVFRYPKSNFIDENGIFHNKCRQITDTIPLEVEVAQEMVLCCN